ncbi:MAG: zinc ribbon domain-containing protein, partial [Thermoanaerobacteraceae bacterium]|nr:zinc ribbon domain-containing protein [Thermoanaerobacteraceae bacterium]
SLDYNIHRGGDILSERFRGMTPEWHKEHDEAFVLAQNEAKEHFHRCHKCRSWVCEGDWNEQEGLCVECAPRMNIEIAAARAEKMIADIKEKAEKTQVFTGKIESKQTFCPECGKPASQGKFCTNCGANLSLAKCPNCGAQNPANTRFCGECGTRLG